MLILIGISNAQPTLPSGWQSYQNITIGSWSGASSQYVQQMVNLTESNYAGLVYNGNQANFEFTYGNGNIIPAWIESNSSGVLTIWLNITNTTTNVYLDIFNSTTNTLSSSGTSGIGEAPELSSTYGGKDDGESVFPAYFNGDTSTSDFSISSASLTQTTATFSNGATINVLKYETTAITQSTTALVYTGSSVGSGNWIAESSFASDGSSTDLGVAGLGQNSGSGTSDNLIQVDTQFSSSYFAESYVSSSSLVNDLNQGGTTTTSFRYGAVYDNASSSYYGYIAPQLYSTSGGYSGTVTTNPVSSISPLYFAVNPVTASSGYWVEFNWARVRAYPPNGVMPSVTFGSVQESYTPPTVSVSPTSQTLDIPQSITLTATVSGGTSPYSYQWYNDTTGTPSAVSGATASTYTVAKLMILGL